MKKLLLLLISLSLVLGTNIFSAEQDQELNEEVRIFQVDLRKKILAGCIDLLLIINIFPAKDREDFTSDINRSLIGIISNIILAEIQYNTGNNNLRKTRLIPLVYSIIYLLKTTFSLFSKSKPSLSIEVD